jgi:uncharacterized membrane protein YiaA
MVADREVKTVRKRGRNVSILLFFAGIVLMLLGIVLVRIIMLGTVYLVFLGALMVLVGAALSDRYGRLARWYGSEAAGTFFKTFLVGVGLSFLGLFMIVLLVFGIQVPIEQRGVYFIFSCGLIFGGIIVLFVGQLRLRMGRRQPFFGGIMSQTGMGRIRIAGSQDIMRLFEQINPEKNFETKNFSVMKKGEVYILLPRMSNAAFFVKLFDQIPVQEKAVRLPMIFFRKTPFEDVAGLPVAKFRGEITIPVDIVKRGNKSDERYVKGAGIQYVVPMYDTSGRRDLSGQLTKTAILNIISEISNESE